MRSYDVFNGDADGICALLQLRLAQPRDAQLITGVKRDIALLQQVPLDQSADVVALDISLDTNRAALDELLAAGSRVFYCDHHYPGESIPRHANLTTLIDTSPNQCTSLLVDQKLQGRFRNWAIAAAFGDNLNAVAEQLSAESGLSSQQRDGLQQLGVCINYNGYGNQLEDLHFHPAELYRALLDWPDPLNLLDDAADFWMRLRSGYIEDMQQGLSCPPLHDSPHALIVALPDKPWARRVSGVLGNELANRNPSRACAVLTQTGAKHWLVSIRAPLNNRTGADELARRYPSGGGRKAAAGINRLPAEQLDSFVIAMADHWR